MKSKHLIFFLFFALILTACKKEYTYTVEKGSLYPGSTTLVNVQTETTTLEADNDQEAAEQAYKKYLISISTAYEMCKDGDALIFLPTKYKLTNSKGEVIPHISPEEKDSLCQVHNRRFSLDVENFYKSKLPNSWIISSLKDDMFELK